MRTLAISSYRLLGNAARAGTRPDRHVCFLVGLQGDALAVDDQGELWFLRLSKLFWVDVTIVEGFSVNPIILCEGGRGHIFSFARGDLGHLYLWPHIPVLGFFRKLRQIYFYNLRHPFRWPAEITAC